MASLRILAPPAHTRVLLMWEPNSDKDLTKIRDGILRFFSSNPTAERAGSSDVAQSLGVVATELAGNALRHGSPPVIVRLLRDDNCYILDISDGDTDRVPQPGRAQPGFHAGGRGLQISLAMAEQVNWYRTETAKHVWASFPAPPP
jgi:hypothetical protein